MGWRIELTEYAARMLDDLDAAAEKRIRKFIRERLGKLEDPRSVGQALRGSKLGEFWKYRVGDYRIICRIEDQRLVIVVVRIGHRREVYRG